MNFKFNKELYSKPSLFKTCYKYLDDFYIHLDQDDTYYYVTIEAKNETTVINKKEFQNEMMDQMNREIVFSQTKNIREILMARAFASTVVYDESVVENFENDESEMLKDWFDNE